MDRQETAGKKKVESDIFNPLSLTFLLFHTSSTMGTQTEMLNFALLNPATPSILSPRLGRLAIGTKALNTPHYIPLTSRGAVPHLSHDVVRDHTSIGSIYLGLEDCTHALFPFL